MYSTWRLKCFYSLLEWFQPAVSYKAEIISFNICKIESISHMLKY